MKKSPTPNKKERGQSLMELAVSLLILLMILTGAVETSLALFQFVTIRDAAEEGVLYGSINPTDVAGIKYRAQDTASDVVQVPLANITVKINGTEIVAGDPPPPGTCEGSTGGVPNSITVDITFAHQITYPFVAPMIGRDTIDLRATATNTILQPACP